MIALRTERPSASSDECSLCNTPHPKSDGPASPVKQRTDLLPWTVVVTAAVVITAMGAGPERWFGVGAVSGLLAGIACAWVSFQAARRSRGAAHVRELASLAEDSDARVHSVIKQFEWAVSDVVKLKRDSERAQGAADALMERSRERERYVKKLERQIFELREQVAHSPQAAAPVPEDTFDGPDPSRVPFRWALHIDGTKATLELETGVTLHRPSRVRVVDRDGQVTAVSGVPVLLADGGYGFTVEDPPIDLVTDLDAGREPNYVIEALVQYEWRPTRLEDSGRRTRIVADNQGRFYRVADAADAAQVFAARPPRANLN
ncbi:MAG: hypothetical protein ABJB39_01860 [Chloroflexota bacterium]